MWADPGRHCGDMVTEEEIFNAEFGIRHCEERSDEAIQGCPYRPGLLRSARNDAVRMARAT
jgi:hypothetical protein